MVDPTNLIEAVVGGFVERIQDNINAIDDFTVTGKIADIEIRTVDNEVQVTAPDYFIYQSRGVNGSVEQRYNTPHKYTNKLPPVQVFKDWIKNKSIRLERNEPYAQHTNPSYERPFKELTEEEQINKAAWGMATNVFKYGIKSKDLYESLKLLLKKLHQKHQLKMLLKQMIK
ncbi:MAG: hypothetical protein EOO46_01360 [Flavobacterium sp.]|nr:MAG: hypothetical protein EOO46_01360 [Flavobacterium sp.]